MRFKLGVLLFFTLIILAFGFYMLASAQEDVRIEIKLDEGETPGDRDVMIIQEIETSDEGESPSPETFVESKDGDMIRVDEGEIDEDGGGRRSERRANREERQRMRRESRERMKKEAMQKGDSPDVTSDKKMRENEPNEAKEQAKKASEQKQKEQAKTQVPISDEDKLKQYLSAISEKNLFLPLGTVKREQKASYAVTAIISNTSEEARPKAIIEQAGTNKSYYVSEGDNLVGEEKVTEIEEDLVKVDRSGKEITLKLGTGTKGGGQWKGGGGGPRGRNAPGGPPSEKGKTASRAQSSQPGGGPNLDQLPPMVRKMLEERGISIEELKNNPELQQKLRQEFMQRSGGRGQRPRRSGIQMEVRPR